MARLVVLSFEDNEAAEQWVSETQDHDGRFLTGPEYGEIESSFDVVGFFALPTQFCDGQCYVEKDGRGPKFVQGEKYGWWVCLICHKPLDHKALYRQVIAHARNLLPERTAEPSVMPWDPCWGKFRKQRIFPAQAERMRAPYNLGSRRYGRFAFELEL